MINAMFDLETLGLKHDAAILSIGVALFDEDTIRDTLHVVLKEPMHGSIDASTVMWWIGQSDVARRSLLEAPRIDDVDASVLLRLFLEQFPLEEIWANSPGFDLTILESWWNRIAKTPWPLKFYGYRDFRTLRKLADECRIKFERIEPEIAHNALSDAVAQAEYVIAVKKLFKEKTNGICTKGA
jgi:3' exoribonuclease, RNase T-like